MGKITNELYNTNRFHRRYYHQIYEFREHKPPFNLKILVYTTRSITQDCDIPKGWNICTRINRLNEHKEWHSFQYKFDTHKGDFCVRSSDIRIRYWMPLPCVKYKGLLHTFQIKE